MITKNPKQTNKKKIQKAQGVWTLRNLSCSLFFLLSVTEGTEQVSQGSQTQSVCYKLYCGVKWVKRETNFPYLYLSQHNVLQCRSRTGGKITGVATQTTLKFYMILPIKNICKKKNICSLKSKVSISLQRKFAK